MYKAVPPPDETAGKFVTSSNNPPANIKKDQWQKFQDLKMRRIQISGAGRRARQCKKKILNKVSKELDASDKLVLAGKGVVLPEFSKKKVDVNESGTELPSSSQKRPRPREATSDCSSVTDWSEVKSYLDPNPHLKGWCEEEPEVKSGLEKELNVALEEGDLKRAVHVSDKISSGDLACKVATAFDCVNYAKRCKMEEDKKKSKPAKLKWMFDKKHRWESKGNM